MDRAQREGQAMTILSHPSATHDLEEVMELHTGDRMNREEFHRAYLQTPEGFKAELIGGRIIRFMAPGDLPSTVALGFLTQGTHSA